MSFPVLALGPSVHLTLVLVALSAPLAISFVRGLALERRALQVLRGLCALGVLGLCGAFAAWKSGVFPWAAWGVAIAWTTIPVLAATTASLPIALVVQRGPSIAKRALAFVSRSKRPLEPGSCAKFSRRAALGIPIVAGSVAGYGFLDGEKPARLRIFELPKRGLHRDLDGLRILQLSDLHLGTGLDARHLDGLVTGLSDCRPDLVVLTGDVADTTAALEEGLPIIERLRPRYGTFAVLGNHEYLSQRVEEMCALYATSGVRLLVNEAITLAVGRAKLALIGVDDPLGTPETTIASTVVDLGRGLSDSDYRLLLSHRPSGFENAERAGIELTLSGHTHGGQVGWFGKSLAELAGVASWVWGFYRSNESVLYTTSGAGDWFPFRLNCPREAPLLVLRQSQPSSGSSTPGVVAASKASLR